MKRSFTPIRIAACCAAMLLAAAPLAPGALIAHYTLDNNTNDATSNGNDGTTSGTTSFSTDTAPVPGGSTHSLMFNDSGNANDGFVDLPEGDQSEPDNDLFIDGSFTVASWVKFDARSTSAGAAKIVGNYQTSSPFEHNYLLRVFQEGHGNSNQVAFIARDQSGDTVTLTDPDVPSLDEWVHYAATFDSTDGTTKLFRNGSEVASGTLSNFNGFDATGQVASLADAASGNMTESRNFNGKLDDVRIYNEALSQSQVQTLIIPTPAALPGGVALLAMALLRRRRRS